MTALTLLAARGQRGDGSAALITFGSLVVIMILLSPVCHLHYFSLELPLIMGLMASFWETKKSLPAGLFLLLAVTVVANILPHFPGLEMVRDGGMAMYAALLLWVVGIGVLYQRRRAGVRGERKTAQVNRAAA